MPEWLKGTGCKPVGLAYVGSNPTPSTMPRLLGWFAWDFLCEFGGEWLVWHVYIGLYAIGFTGEVIRQISMLCGHGEMVSHEPSKLLVRVRFPLPAPKLALYSKGTVSDKTVDLSEGRCAVRGARTLGINW